MAAETITYHFAGDQQRARTLRWLGLKQVNILRQEMAFAGLEQYRREAKFDDGTVITCTQTFGAASVEIYAPPQEQPVEQVKKPEGWVFKLSKCDEDPVEKKDLIYLAIYPSDATGFDADPVFEYEVDLETEDPEEKFDAQSTLIYAGNGIFLLDPELQSDYGVDAKGYFVFYRYAGWGLLTQYETITDEVDFWHEQNRVYPGFVADILGCALPYLLIEIKQKQGSATYAYWYMVWDMEKHQYAENVLDDGGNPVTEWPVPKDDIDTWLAQHVAIANQADLISGSVAESTPLGLPAVAGSCAGGDSFDESDEITDVAGRGTLINIRWQDWVEECSAAANCTYEKSGHLAQRYTAWAPEIELYDPNVVPRYLYRGFRTINWSAANVSAEHSVLARFYSDGFGEDPLFYDWIVGVKNTQGDNYPVANEIETETTCHWMLYSPWSDESLGPGDDGLMVDIAINAWAHGYVNYWCNVDDWQAGQIFRLWTSGDPAKMTDSKVAPLHKYNTGGEDTVYVMGWIPTAKLAKVDFYDPTAAGGRADPYITQLGLISPWTYYPPADGYNQWSYRLQHFCHITYGNDYGGESNPFEYPRREALEAAIIAALNEVVQDDPDGTYEYLPGGNWAFATEASFRDRSVTP